VGKGLEDEILDAASRLATAVGSLCDYHGRWLDQPDPRRRRGLMDIAAADPWALTGFTDPTWARYQSPTDATTQSGLRIGQMGADTRQLPPIPAIVPFIDPRHLLIYASARLAAVARALLPTRLLRLINASTPGSMRLALVDFGDFGSLRTASTVRQTASATGLKFLLFLISG
jgi:hypothetical protein